ncbi:MAG: FlgD immunoglobulin-like domain containing protein [Akkermansiaceae bacterium]|nr:FlgD immunoglobulin-like domain containing protein [Akkermansiaceae bacterium]
MLKIISKDGSAINAEFSVVAPPVSGELELDRAGSTGSHWSKADIVFTAPGGVNLGETWTLELTRPGETSGRVLTNQVSDADDNGTIDVNDVALGFALLLGNSDLASGSTLTYIDSIGVAATLTVTPLAVNTTAVISGTFADQWQQTIEFTGGKTGGASTEGDTWKVKIADQTVLEQTSGADLNSVVTAFSDDLNTAPYERISATNNRLTFKRTDGELVDIEFITQTRNRTIALLGSATTQTADDRSHYATIELTLESEEEPSHGDVWEIVLNGKKFSVEAEKGKSLAHVVNELKMKINDYSEVYNAEIDAVSNTKIIITPDRNAWFTGILAEANEGDGIVKALFDIDNTEAERGVEAFWFSRYAYTDSLFLEIFDDAGNPVVTKNTGVAQGSVVDEGSSSHLDPFLDFEFDKAGTYVVRVGTFRNFDDPDDIFVQDFYAGVSKGISYELNISLQRHARNDEAIELVGKQITIVDGTGEDQTAEILAYDAISKSYTVDRKWEMNVDETSKFEIEYDLAEEFSGYQPVRDSYSMVLTSPIEGTDTVVIDVLPQITRAYNSDLSFDPNSNFGESSNEQIDVATPRVIVELAGTPAGGQTWTVTLNGQNYSYLVNDGDTLENIADGLASVIDTMPLGDSETFVAISDGTSITITSSIYQAQITSGTAGSPTAFTTEFSIPNGSGEISAPNVIGGWNEATIELKGSVQEGSSWTLRLDGINYTHVVNGETTLDEVVFALRAILPGTFSSTVDPDNGARFTVTKPNTTNANINFDRFKASFTVGSATKLRPQLVFTANTWDTPQDVIVWAADDDIVDGGDAKVVAAVEGRVNSVRGPLIINGGFLEGVDRSLNDPYLLPGETNNPLRDGIIENAGVHPAGHPLAGNAYLTDGITKRQSGIDGAVHVNPATGLQKGFDPRMNGNFYGFTILDGVAAGTFLRVLEVSEDLETVTFVGAWPDDVVPVKSDSYYYAPINPNVLVDEVAQVDSLIVDNTDSPAFDTGVLTETRLTGLGMGSDTRIGTKTLQGGITYLNLESLDIGLGVGKDNFTIESTHSGTTKVSTGDTLLDGVEDDVINIETLLGHTFIDTGSGDDRINVGTARHLLDENGGLLTLIGNGGTDELVVDDSSDSTDNTGALMQTTLTGLDMPGVAEVQIVTVLAKGGDYQLSYSDSDGTRMTNPLSLGYDAPKTPAERLQDALNGLFPDSTGIRVEEYRDSFKTVTYTITFGGEFAGRNMNELQWDTVFESTGTGLVAATDSSVKVEVFTKRDGSDAPVPNNVQTFTVDADGGTFTLEFQLDEATVDAIRRGSEGVKPAYSPTILSDTSVEVAALAFNISADELAKYLDPILNPNNSDDDLPHTKNFAVVKVGSVFLITFQGEHRGSRVASVDTTNLINGAGASAGTGTIDVATRTHGINYYEIESLKIELGSGDDVLNVPSTHAGETTIRAGAGSDLIKIETLAGHTFVYLGEGSDTIKVGTARHLLDEIDGLLTVIGGGANDTLLVDDSSDRSNNTGTLDQTTLTGLDMQGVSEVQVMTVQAIGGDFYLNYTDSTGTLTTGALSYDISEGDLASELNTLLGSTGIDVGKYRDSAQNVTYTVTFGGDLAGRDMEQLKWSETVDTSNLVADKDSSVKVDFSTHREGILASVLNTVQTFTINATSGIFKLKFLLSRDMLDAINQGISGVGDVYVPEVTDLGAKGYVTTAELAYDITAEELAKYLDPILNPRNSNDRVSHTRNFSIHQVGDVFLITLKGEHRDSRVAEVDTSGLDGTVDVATRTHGINYYGIESLNIELGSGDDVFNVQGTSAVTSLNTHAGQDQIFVSSNANENQVTRSSSFQAGNAIRFSGDDQPVLAFELSEIASSVIIEIRDSSGALVRAMELTIAELDLLSAVTGSYKTVWDGRDDALQLAVPGAYNFSVVGVRSDGSKFAGLITQTGTLDDVDGELNIDAGTETNSLMVSDIGSPNGDTSGLITDSQISGLAEADINFITTGLQMPNDGLYSEFEEVSVQLGTGHDRLLIENTHAGKTTINTGAGDDRVAIASTSGNLHLEGDAGNDTVRIATSDFDGNLAAGEGFVETIMGHLIFDGGEGEDLMTVNDSNDSTSETGTLTESSLTGFGFNSAPEVQTLTVIGQSGFYRISRGDLNVPWYSIRPGVARPGALGVALDVRFTAAQVQEHLEFVYGFGNVSVNLISEEVGTKKYEITFISELAGADIAPIRWADPGPINLVATADSERAGIIIGTHTPAVKKPSVANTQQFLEIINADRGTFTITLLDQSTEPLPFDISLEALMNALKPILNPNNSNPSKPYHNNFDIEKIGRKFLITFKGEHRDLSIARVDIDVTDLRGGTVNLVTRESGLSYFNLEQLDLSLGDGIDVLNVQGTSATTNIDLGGGDDELYVSSLSDIDFVKRDHSFIGNLDGIGGTLNIDGGSGDQKLLISDASSMDGDFVSVIDRLPLRNLAEKHLNRSSELFIIGASPAPISIQADRVDGSFRKGFRIETGSGDDTVNVTSTIFRNRIVDAGKFDLDTGLGNDNVFASLTADGNSPLIINTESEFNYRMIMRSVPNLANLTNPEDNVLITVDGVRLSSDRFRVVNELNAIDLKIDGDLSADAVVEVQVSRVSRGRVAEVPGQRQYTIDYQLDEGETVKLFSAGEELLLGDDYFFYQIRPQRFILVFIGRFNFFRNGDITWEATRIFSESQTVQSLGQRDDDFVNASGSTLPLSIFTGSGNDVVIGGQGDDVINSGRGDDIVFGRSGSDQIISVEGNQLNEDLDVIFGDDGIVKFKHFPREVTIDSRNAEKQRLPVGDYRLSEVFSVDGGTAGDDVITSGNGDDILIGGFGADQLTSGDGSDILIGDGGRVALKLGYPSQIESTNSFDQSGTDDVLSGGGGANYLIGGLGNDTISTGFSDETSFSVILGDLGEINFTYNASTGVNSVIGMESSFPGLGGDDIITTSGNSDWIIAGIGSDQLTISTGAFFSLGIGSFTPAFANDVLYHEWTILRSFEDSTGGRVITLDGYSLEQRTRLVDNQTGVFYEL